ncbi:MAG: hypothetical protein AAGF56_03560, partial [Pseudomonadota bacterium]
MSNQSAGQRVQTALKQAIESGLLSFEVEARATQLLTRLRQPVRVAVMGMPHAGKSEIVNLLIGANTLRPDVKLPTLQMAYGERAETICTNSDGTKQTLETLNPAEIAALSPVFVEMRAPLPALGKISVLEVVAPNDPNAMHKASQWAAKRADVALWCTKGFDATEQQVWAQMPDLTKDHAFLMVTHADVLRDQNTFDSVMYTLHTVAKDEFTQILAIESTNAIAARKPDGSVDKDLMRSSGGIALIQAVLRQVDLGKQSSIDTAEVLLQQNADVLASLQEQEPVDEPAAAETPEPTEEKTDIGSAAAGLNQIRSIA